MATTDEPKPRPLWQRLGWMVAIWLISVMALGAVAAVIRAVLAP